jgi:hypothetical protein
LCDRGFAEIRAKQLLADHIVLGRTGARGT